MNLAHAVIDLLRIYSRIGMTSGLLFEDSDLRLSTPLYGPAVCCKGKASQRGTLGLAPMYQTYLWSVLQCSWPSWISARIRSH